MAPKRIDVVKSQRKGVVIVVASLGCLFGVVVALALLGRTQVPRCHFGPCDSATVEVSVRQADTNTICLAPLHVAAESAQPVCWTQQVLLDEYRREGNGAIPPERLSKGDCMAALFPGGQPAGGTEPESFPPTPSAPLFSGWTRCT